MVERPCLGAGRRRPILARFAMFCSRGYLPPDSLKVLSGSRSRVGRGLRTRRASSEKGENPGAPRTSRPTLLAHVDLLLAPGTHPLARGFGDYRSSAVVPAIA